MDKPDESFVYEVFERRTMTAAEARKALELFEYMGSNGKPEISTEDLVSLFLAYCEWFGDGGADELEDYDEFKQALSWASQVVELDGLRTGFPPS